MISNDENTVSAKNQVKENQDIFYIGNKNSKLKIAILGNSITRHGPLAEIGWFGLHGMAASSIDKDYVHQLCSFLEKDNKDFYMMVNQVWKWESKNAEFDYTYYKDIKDFKPDVIIFRCGENMSESKSADNLASKINEFLKYLSKSTTEYVITSCFWHNPISDPAIKIVAKNLGVDLVELNDLGDNPKMKAYGLFENPGVAAHPCDSGMEEIAKRIYKVLREII